MDVSQDSAAHLRMEHPQRVVGLQVPVNDACRMYARELLCDVEKHVQDRRRRAVGAEPLLQADAALEREEGRVDKSGRAPQRAVSIGARKVERRECVLQHRVSVRLQLEVKVCALVKEPACGMVDEAQSRSFVWAKIGACALSRTPSVITCTIFLRKVAQDAYAGRLQIMAALALHACE